MGNPASESAPASRTLQSRKRARRTSFVSPGQRLAAQAFREPTALGPGDAAGRRVGYGRFQRGAIVTPVALAFEASQPRSRQGSFRPRCSLAQGGSGILVAVASEMREGHAQLNVGVEGALKCGL